ncbi:fumarylacetoacetate hydrolase family protein [Rhodococcus sp. IEGM 1366]|uniref:fumarylacetoacetate hydrolase family protein n=1 Tax=Rhodococcus sp. IEGM 1366 TaxID=3082223 RepID=UPI00295479AC|nr:fumarylacetoacetate hydrolase family protein [Rhodococcus sp. IEGM 1366]MDV8066910.1 fumarylacetoacetate hydrolase family protein [Rhodococcus sp. IEGM 1366]
MKFVTYLHEDVEQSGVVSGSRVFPIAGNPSVLDLVTSGLDSALHAGDSALRMGKSAALERVSLRAPLQPPTVRDFVAFEEHVEGVRRSIDGQAGVVEAWYEAPRFYFTNPYAIVGPDEQVRAPYGCAALDFELEVAAVIGRSGSGITAKEATDHIFGYTILNDWSARDLQSREMQVNLGPSKGKDFATSIGPWLVTADELDPYRDSEGFLDLECTVGVNGVEVGRDMLSNMGWTFETMTAYASRDTWVHPGDILGSGTVGNGGCLAELWGRNGERTPAPLRVGDRVVLSVDVLGTLANTVVAELPAPALPPVRRRDHARARASLRAAR